MEYLKRMKRRLIGDRAFYALVLATAVPMMIQNGFTNFVSLLDNIMVGQLGTEPMSGVSIVNQLIFVYQLTLFGACSGAGIFTAQFEGSRNVEGVRSTFQFKLLVSVALSAVAMGVLTCFGPQLISLYLHDEGGGGDVVQTLAFAQRYLNWTLIWLIPNAVSISYATHLRETGHTMVPMVSGVTAVLVNLVFNYLLIFGKLGFPEMGVAGAALATALSRFVECGINILWTHLHPEQCPYILGAYRRLHITASLARRITVKGMPLMVNEFFWSMAMAFMTQCYSMRGLSAVAALNICSVRSNVFNTVFQALGNAIGILAGQKLGAGQMEEAKDTAVKMNFFSLASCAVMSALMILFTPLFCGIYKVDREVYDLAVRIVRIAALCMPIRSFANACYFTLRSGGKVLVTFLFDSVSIWLLNVPLAFCLSRFTGMPIETMYLCCQLIDLVKCTVGFVMVKKGIWLHNIVAES